MNQINEVGDRNAVGEAKDAGNRDVPSHIIFPAPEKDIQDGERVVGAG